MSEAITSGPKRFTCLPSGETRNLQKFHSARVTMRGGCRARRSVTRACVCAAEAFRAAAREAGAVAPAGSPHQSVSGNRTQTSGK